jgi:ABC-type dipeptide/oligopeptide/nickel transport system ATPase component
MKIIALVGPSDCGKTETLNYVYNTILANGGLTSNKTQLGGQQNDFSDIVTYKGMQLAFFTMGDYSNPLVTATRNYYSLNCDVLICACNNRFARPFYEFNNPIYNYHQINKVPQPNSSLQQNENINDAQTIFNLI